MMIPGQCTARCGCARQAPDEGINSQPGISRPVETGNPAPGYQARGRGTLRGAHCTNTEPAGNLSAEIWQDTPAAPLTEHETGLVQGTVLTGA